MGLAALPLLFLFAAVTALRLDFVALSQTSHVLSVHGLAQQLHLRGHNVSFLSFEENRPLTKAGGVPFVSLGDLPHPHSYYDYAKARRGPAPLCVTN